MTIGNWKSGDSYYDEEKINILCNQIQILYLNGYPSCHKHFAARREAKLAHAFVYHIFDTRWLLLLIM